MFKLRRELLWAKILLGGWGTHVVEGGRVFFRVAESARGRDCSNLGRDFVEGVVKVVFERFFDSSRGRETAVLGGK